ncbi:MAG TPA: fluoride efflux transporter CrcB [Chitinophagaceae bacterium]|nr:fluoride efflux transporter CrcB [Chitinophagaceae bacterium]
MLKNFLLVGIGGMAGSILRYATSLLIKNLPNGFPIATFIVNIIGSFIIGWVFGVAIKESGYNWNWKLFIATGICGGFTTFSAFTVEGVALLQQHRFTVFAFYVISSLVLGLSAAWVGIILGK